MNKHFSRTLSFVICIMLAALTLCAGTAAAEEATPDFLGKPFPDFTATDTEGNTFTLSEALKNHEAVLINVWATWCRPCRREFPALNDVYQKYGDKVAFIALSKEPNDTLEVIEAFRKAMGITFAMGRDEGRELFNYISPEGIPATVVVDRFGNAAFYRCGSFTDARQVELVLDTFLGDGYTETAVLTKIPLDASTRAFPVSAARTVYPESGNYRKVLLSTEDGNTITGWIIPDDSVRLRVEIAANDYVNGITLLDVFGERSKGILDLLDQERGVFVYDLAMPDKAAEYQFSYIWLFDKVSGDDPNAVEIFLFRNEEAVDQLIQVFKAEGETREITWAYAEEEVKQENAPQAYTIHVVDQNNKPVPEVMVNFCTDTACVPNESDENGTVTFTGAPDVYHVQIIEVPDGYSWDESYEMYTTREYGEWILRVRKD
jgi:peroxiredoxin